MADIPRCKNRACDRSDTVLGRESQTEWVFVCKTCLGVEVRTKPAGWRAGEQVSKYQKYGRPEYARERAYFDLGRGRK